MSINATVLLLLFVSVSAVRYPKWPPLNCSQQGLKCVASITNCLDSDWLRSHKYTPSSPEELHASVTFREDTRGQLQPVLHVSWKIKDDGSIIFLNATQLHVLEVSTNRNVCIRYSFGDRLSMRNPAKEKWSFSADILAVEPDENYMVSVYNIPRPELDHSYYDVSTGVTAPGCQEKRMKFTEVCIEQGSLWQPNISLAAGQRVLAVSFHPDALSEDYLIIARCSMNQDFQFVNKVNESSLSANFSLDRWPRSCCQFFVEIKPKFPRCGQDCTRHARKINICQEILPDPPALPVHAVIALPVVFILGGLAIVGYCFRRRAESPAKVPLKAEEKQQLLKQPPKVLVIYSQDHPLYTDIVLKLCAFLQAKCGAEVLLDLLDSTSVGMVGPLRWLELQLQKLKDPCDKILVLCSRGVQAKWSAICGQGRVTLRQDLLSPTAEIVTPFLNLLLPDMHQAGMLGKYVIAYFDEVTSDRDVPSVFDIAVKYKLMKHFEALYFRILDIEKYQPHQVNHIEGIDCDEYFCCASGEALKDTIQSFKAFQFEQPNWFENQCVEGEEDVVLEACVPGSQLQTRPVLEYLPLIRDGPPVFTCEVEIKESASRVHVCSPEMNPQSPRPSAVEQTPVIRRGGAQQQPANQPFMQHMDPVVVDISARRQKKICFNVDSFRQLPVEDNEDSPLAAEQLSSSFMDSSRSEGLAASEVSPSHLVSMEEEEEEDLEPKKIQSNRSDQGYISKMSSQQEPVESSLVALRRLQEELLLTSLHCSDQEETLNLTPPMSHVYGCGEMNDAW